MQVSVFIEICSEIFVSCIGLERVILVGASQGCEHVCKNCASMEANMFDL
jgi:hypothetical protein